MLLKISFFSFTTCFSSSHFFFFLGALPILGLLNNLRLLYLYMLISLMFMLLANTFCLHFLFMLLSSIGDLEKYLPNYEFCRFNLVDDLPSSLRSICLSF